MSLYTWQTRFPASQFYGKCTYRSILTPGAASVNYATHALYNPGPLLVVVRAVSMIGGTGGVMQPWLTQRGQIGSTIGAVYSTLQNIGASPPPTAQHSYLDNATLFSAQEVVQGFTSVNRSSGLTWQILPPGWSLIFQQGVKAGAVVGVSWQWEELALDNAAVASGVVVPVSQPYNQVVLADGPVGFWPLDDAVGSVAVRDLSGNGVSGQVHGGVTLGVPGGCADGSTAGTFDGSSGWVSVFGGTTGLPSDGSNSTTTMATMEFAGKCGSVSRFVGAYDTNPQNFHTLRGYSAAAGNVNNSGVGWIPLVDLNYNPTDTNWHLYQVVHRRGPSSVFVDLWVDGVLVTTGAGGTAQDPFIFSTGQWVWGAVNLGGAGYWLGGMQKLAVYPVALSAQQIASHWFAFHGTW